MEKEIIVVPNSKKEQVFGEDILKVKVKSKPENNKANVEVEKVLSKYFGKKVKIVKGFKSRKKIVEME